MGLFSKMKEATYSQTGTYLTPNCTYTLKLVSAIVGAKQVTGDEYFVATFEVLETDDATTKIGAERSYFVGNFGNSKLSFLGNVKKLVVALCGSLGNEPVDPADVGEQDVLDLLKPGAAPGSAPGTMAAGALVKCKTKGVKTKAKTDFTVHDFEPVIV